MNRIKELRKKNSITARGLAQKIGISQSMLTRYENYNVNICDNSIWEKLAMVLGVSQSHVMGITVDFPREKNRELTQEIIMDIIKYPINVKLNSRLEAELIQSLLLLDEAEKKRVFEDVREMMEHKVNENWWGKQNGYSKAYDIS